MWLAAWEVLLPLQSELELELAQLVCDNLMAVSALPFDGIPSGYNHHGSLGSLVEGRNCEMDSLRYGHKGADTHEAASQSHSHTNPCLKYNIIKQ